jgi:hypothetical protein
VKISPNPSNGIFTINLASNIDEEAHVVITNVLGQKLKEFATITNKTAVLQLGEAAGLYVLTVSTAHGQHVAKVIVR